MEATNAVCCHPQSLESLIITAILFGVTVKTLNKKQRLLAEVEGEGRGRGQGIAGRKKERKKRIKNQHLCLSAIHNLHRSEF